MPRPLSVRLRLHAAYTYPRIFLMSGIGSKPAFKKKRPAYAVPTSRSGDIQPQFPGPGCRSHGRAPGQTAKLVVCPGTLACDLKLGPGNLGVVHRPTFSASRRRRAANFSVSWRRRAARWASNLTINCVRQGAHQNLEVSSVSGIRSQHLSHLSPGNDGSRSIAANATSRGQRGANEHNKPGPTCLLNLKISAA